MIHKTRNSKLKLLLSLKRIIRFPVYNLQFPWITARRQALEPNSVNAIRHYSLISIILCAFYPSSLNAFPDMSCLDTIDPSDAILISASDDHSIFKQNEIKKYIPASTLKILTALTAIRYFGSSNRFRTEFYTDYNRNLIIKGFGDPLLTSEVWQELSKILASKIQQFNDLILDDSYFSKKIIIPGVEKSTNPYDAPLGALCANFNTVFFDHDNEGHIVSAEPQTPMTSFAREKISALGQKKGRYTFSHDQQDAARYAGEIFLYFLNQQGVQNSGKIHLGTVTSKDTLLYTYLSNFTLEVAIKKMMKFSNNFMANQICIALGAHVYGPPGNLKKGVRVISDYAEKELHLKDLVIVEGSGISRKNCISAVGMQTVLENFEPYRHLLKRSGNILFKSGTLKNIHTRAGYIERSGKNPYTFSVFLNSGNSSIESLMECIENTFSD